MPAARRSESSDLSDDSMESLDDSLSELSVERTKVRRSPELAPEEGNGHVNQDGTD